MAVVQKMKKLLLFKIITRKILSDANYYRYCYAVLFGKKLSLEKPQGFNAKLQWLKLYYRDDLLTRLADKFEVRKYVAETIGEKYLVPLIKVYSSAKEMDWEHLPEKFVLKATHGSGWNVICRNKNILDTVRTEKLLAKWLKTNYYSREKEWQYKNIRPRLICEQYLETENTDLLEIKLFCYNGIPEFVVAYPAQGTYRNIYSNKWERIKGRTAYAQGPDIPCPANLGLIKELASQLSKPFPFVRVDFFITGNSIFFGEMTFTPARGFYPFTPQSLDLVFGNPLRLPLTKGMN